MKTHVDYIHQLMDELVEEGQGDATAQAAAAEVERRAKDRDPDAWEWYATTVVAEALQSRWRSLQRERKVNEALEAGQEKMSRWGRQAKAKMDERRTSK